MRVARVFSWKSALVVLSLGVFGLTLVGCSTDAPFAPSNKIEPLNAIVAAERCVAVDQLEPEEGVVIVGRAGGVIDLSFGTERSRLVIPPRALRGPVRIEAEAYVVEARGRKVWLFDFSPDGLRFLRPARLYLDTEMPRGEPLKLYWFNPQTGRWQLEQVSSTDNSGKVVFLIHHFSKYAIS